MSRQDLLDKLATFLEPDIIDKAAEAWNFVHDLLPDDTSLDYPEILKKAPAFAVALLLAAKKGEPSLPIPLCIVSCLLMHASESPRVGYSGSHVRYMRLPSVRSRWNHRPA